MSIHNHPITPILLLLLTSQLGLAQPSPSGPGDGPGTQINSSPSMGIIIIVLIAALFFMGFFSIYIRHCSDGMSTGGAVGRGIGSIRRSRRAPRGLDPEVIESFPIFDYAAVKSEKIGKGALECAVCLTEFEDDDELRLIPKCDHVFHPDCIDAWLVGHTTCPVCRCNLADAAIGEQEAQPNDVVLEAAINEESRENDDQQEQQHEGSDSMEQPLHGRIGRSRTMRNLSFGRPRWLGKFTRSFSTGHVAVKQWDNMERFTLRLPEEVRKQIISGKLERTTSLLVLPRETSSRRGYRTGFGEGSSRGVRFSSARVDRPILGRSDRWVFSMAPPFLTRVPSIKSPRVAATSPTSRGGSLRGYVRENNNVTTTTTTTSREGSLRGAMQAEVTQLPV